MSEAQKFDVIQCISFYQSKGLDWSDVAEFLICSYNGNPYWITMMKFPGGRKKPNE